MTKNEKTKLMELKKEITENYEECEKPIKTLNINGNKCGFLGYTVNGEDRKGCFLLKELNAMIEYIRGV